MMRRDDDSMGTAKSIFLSEEFKVYTYLYERGMADTQKVVEFLLKSKDKRIAELEVENEELRKRLDRIEQRSMRFLS